MSRTRTPRQWREILDAFEHSNLSQAEFCRRRGLALATFRYRRARTETQVSAELPRLVELFTEPPSETPPEALRLELDLPLGPATIHGHPAMIAELLSLLAPTPAQPRL
jgi:hypothetical protein